MREHYFNYLYFHALPITPTNITIPDATVRILVYPLSRSLSLFLDLAYVRAQRIMFLSRFLV